MIDVIVSNRCPYCVEQKEIMDRYFFDDEYRIIDSGGEDFAGYKYASKIRAVPCIVVENDNKELVYAGIGIHSEERLRNIAFGEANSALVLHADCQDKS